MVNTGEVIDDYIIWELCKERGIQNRILEESPDGKELKQEILSKVRQEYLGKNYSREEKRKMISELGSNPEYRTRIFENSSWKIQKVKVEELGTTLPRAMGLPPEVITGSLTDVIDFVEKADPKQYRSIKYIRKLEQVPKLLEEFKPPVITPGKSIREPERMRKVHGEKQWNIKETWGAVHDANHRTIAKIISNNLKQVECYVGHR